MIFSLYYSTAFFPDELGLWVKRERSMCVFTFFKELYDATGDDQEADRRQERRLVAGRHAKQITKLYHEILTSTVRFSWYTIITMIVRMADLRRSFSRGGRSRGA